MNLEDYHEASLMVAKFERLSEAQTWKIMKQITNGLAFIHENHMIHGDLKPCNGKRIQKPLFLTTSSIFLQR